MPDGINRCVLPRLLTQEMMHMNKYPSSFQPKYVERAGQVVSYAVTPKLHLVRGMMIMAI